MLGANELVLEAASVDDVDEVARLVTEDAADINTCDINGSTCLHAAAELGSLRMIELLLSFGARSDSRRLDKLGGFTAFAVAVDRGHLECADVLADAGADVNTPSSTDQTTPLHRAAARGDALFVKFLLSRGADANRRCAAGRNASHHAYSNGHDHILVIYSMPPPAAPSAEEVVTFKQMQQAQYALLMGPKAAKAEKKTKGTAKK